MTVIVRTLRPGSPSETAGFARVRRACVPAMLATPASLAHDVSRSHPDAHYRQLIAVADDEVVGTAQVGIAYDSPRPGQGFANVYVHPDHENRGAGGLLLRTAEEHLARHGAREVFCWALDGERNLGWAAAHGYRPSRSAHFLRLDLAADGALPPRAPLPAGVELRTGADYAADPRPLFALDAETAADEPGDIATLLTDYEQWLADTWQHPLLDHALTSVAVVDGRPAAFTLAHTDGDGRYASGMTGTGRAYRGRGLAKLAKNDSLHRAREAGMRVAYTGNDAGNAPMLAINTWFGYTRDAKEIRHVRALDA
ncbi:GNAT family N-acetyltransferase [Streptomyces sp. NPDC088785]|uniref:GNAT family N-acetyltransferase n=1 Tax=Streptomyces sp. NPDC088785 TaxID=3365897 RepID=UPI003830C558